MSKGFDYAKWDNIELSDDEDDVHPNIERESWFRMKHRSRVEREEREETDKKKIKGEMKQADLRIKEINLELKKLKSGTPDPDDSDDDDLEDTEGLEAELKELEQANQKRQQKLDDYEKNKKWNVDNLCKVVDEKTIINPKSGEEKFTSTGYALPDEDVEKSAAAVPAKGKKNSSDSSSKFKETAIHTPVQGPTSDSVAMLSYHDFTQKYADIVEKFMTLSSLEQSKQFLLLNGNIILQENASNYLLLASLEDEMNGLRVKMKLTARQSQIISNIAELAKTMKRHPGNVVIPFFTRIQQKEYHESFMEGVNAFIEKIIARSVVKKKEMDAERAKKDGDADDVDLKNVPKEQRLGPGGLDPVEVFESLPESMQEAFESRDNDKLKAALMTLDMKDVEYHMKRCVDSGLWNE